MEHIVQFGIGIDDEVIKKRIEEAAYNDVVKQLVSNCEKTLCEKGYRVGYYSKNNVDWSKLAYDTMRDLVNEHKEEIIEAAASKLFESIRKTKAFKEKMQSVVEENI